MQGHPMHLQTCAHLKDTGTASQKENDRKRLKRMTRKMGGKAIQIGSLCCYFFLTIKKRYKIYCFFNSYFPNTFFSTVQHGDPVTHTRTHSIFSHYHAPS